MGRGSFFGDDDEDSFVRPPLEHTLSHVKRQFSLRKPICPFVSSTFQDFQKEREHLIKKVFPTIDALARERGTYFAPVDLRWGINDMQASSGHVIQLCLDYINRSAPFFICLLGERYGAHRPSNSPHLPQNYEELTPDAHWLDRNFMVAASGGHDWVLQEAHQESSVTELEIINAAFLNDSEYCYFYFRQSDHVENLYTDLPEDERQDKLKIYYSQSEYEKFKVRELKQRIVKKGLPVKYFRTPEELGRLLLEDWTNALDLLYPPLEEMVTETGAEQFREWMAHEAFAETRRRVFVSTPEIQAVMAELTRFGEEALEEYYNESLDGDSNNNKDKYQSQLTIPFRKIKPPEIDYTSILMLEGERGCGKTSCLSNWVKEFSAENPDIKVISHYVGSNSQSTDIASFMRRCTLELREEYHNIGAESDVTAATEDLADFHRICEAFIAATSMGPSVLVLDGIDELGGTYGLTPQQVKELSWLPMPLPPQCKLIVSTVKADLTFRSLSQRGDTKALSVPLVKDKDSRRKVMNGHLAVHCKCLNNEQLERIVSSKLSNRPLFLAVLANELRVFGVYSRLDYHLNSYLEASSIRDLWARIIQRWIKDYGWTSDSRKSEFSHRSHNNSTVGWVADSLRLIACSQHGLSQSEILCLLKQLGYQDESEVTGLDWLMFRSAALDSLFERPGGLLNFFHQHLKEAVEYALLGSVTPAAVTNINSRVNPLASPREMDKKSYHTALANYFYSQEHSTRRTEELPWQLEMAGDMQRLCKVLSQPSVFLEMVGDNKHYHNNKLKLIHYWKLLKDGGFDPSVEYQKMLAKTGAFPGIDLEALENPTSNVEFSLPGEDDEPDQPLRSTPSIPKILMTRASELSINPDHVSGRLSSAHVSSAHMSSAKVGVDDQDSDTADVESFTSYNISETSTEWSSFKDTDGSSDTLTETREGPSPVEDPSQLSLHEIASLAKNAGLFLAEMGYFQQSEQMLLRAHNQLNKNYPLSEEGQKLLCGIQESIGDMFLFQLKKDVAESWYRKALYTLNEYSENVFDASDALASQETKGRLLDHLGHMKTHAGLFSEAEEYLSEAQQCMETACSTTGKATVQYHLGVLRMKQEDYIRAESCFRQAIAIREQWYGKSHPTVAEVLNDLAGLLCNNKNARGYDQRQAESLYRRALKIREQCLGPEHLLLATTLFHLGKLLNFQGSFPAKREAMQHLKRALDIRTQKLGGEHSITKAVRRVLSNLETNMKLGHYEFGPAKPTDERTPARPYSSLSFRERDMSTLDQRSTKSRPKSGTTYVSRTMSHVDSLWPSRPVSRITNYESTIGGFRDNESENGYHGDENQYDSKGFPDESSEFGDSGVQIRLRRPKKHGGKLHKQGKVEDEHIENYADELNDKVSDMKIEKKNQKDNALKTRPKSAPQKLQRFATASLTPRDRPGSRLHSSRAQSRMSTSSRFTAKTNSSWKSNVSMETHKSKCYVPGEHTIDSHNAYSIRGPHSSIIDLLGPPPCPRELTRGSMRSAAWYHVPGRYPVPGKPHPPKRSQKRWKFVPAATEFTDHANVWDENDGKGPGDDYPEYISNYDQSFKDGPVVTFKEDLEV